MTSGQRKIALFPVLIYTTAAPLEPFGGGGLVQAVAGFGGCCRQGSCRSRQKLVFEYPLPISQGFCVVLDVRQNPPDVGCLLGGHAAVLVEIEGLVTHWRRSRQCAAHRTDRST